MIYTYEDFEERMQELYPTLTPASIKKIIKEGTKSINRLLRTGNDLILKPSMRLDGYEGYWIKFHAPIFDQYRQNARDRKNKEKREEYRKEAEERLQRWESKSKKLSKITAERNKQLGKEKKAKRREEEKSRILTPEEREAKMMRRRKKLRKTRMRKIEEAKKQEEQQTNNNSNAGTTEPNIT